MERSVMLICPDCHAKLPASDDMASCSDCSWRIQQRGRVPVYLSASDLADPMFGMYLDNYDQIATDDLHNSIQESTYIAAQAGKIIDYIGNIENLRVCEVGVGQGTLLRLLARQHPADLVGLDISMAYLERLVNEGFRVYVCNAENLVFDKEFDLMVATDILEHVLNVGDFLIGINRALVAGGRFVVRVPFEENLVQYAQQMGCPYRLVHLRNFTLRGLTQLLGQGGFEVEAVHLDGFHCNYPRPIYPSWIASRARRLIEMNEQWLRGMPALHGMVERALLRPLEVTAVCRKLRDLPLPPRNTRPAAAREPA